MRDPYRRVRSARPVGRVSSGQDVFDKEAVEGNQASEFYTVRREVVSRLSTHAPTQGGGFAERLQRKVVEGEANQRGKK